MFATLRKTLAKMSRKPLDLYVERYCQDTSLFCILSNMFRQSSKLDLDTSWYFTKHSHQHLPYRDLITRKGVHFAIIKHTQKNCQETLPFSMEFEKHGRDGKPLLLCPFTQESHFSTHTKLKSATKKSL